jgi:hypothetical protein
MSTIAYPYLRLTSAAVAAGDWSFADGSAAPDVMAHWDYGRDIKLQRVVTIDLARASAELMIAQDDLHLAVVVSGASGGAAGQRDRRVVARASFAPDATSVTLRVTLEGAGLSAALALMTDIVLSRAPQKPARLSPQDPGLRLWSDRSTFQLETAASRFPIEAADFRTMFPGHAGDALFHLDCGDDLDHDFAGAVRLYINSVQSEFVQRVEAGDPVTLKLVMAPVMSQILRMALASDEFDPAAKTPGSIGAVALAWAELAFPAHPIETVRAIARHDDAQFESAMSALAAAMVARNA